MTYVEQQTSAELRAHMRALKRMHGWHEPLADRLFREVEAQDEQIKQLRALLSEAPVLVVDSRAAQILGEAEAVKYAAAVKDWHTKARAALASTKGAP